MRGGMLALHVEPGVEELDGLKEVEALVDHDDVDGIEVDLTPEAPGKIVLGLGGGVELAAVGAEEDRGHGAVPFLIRIPQESAQEVNSVYRVPAKPSIRNRTHT